MTLMVGCPPNQIPHISSDAGDHTHEFWLVLLYPLKHSTHCTILAILRFLDLSAPLLDKIENPLRALPVL